MSEIGDEAEIETHKDREAYSYDLHLNLTRAHAHTQKLFHYITQKIMHERQSSSAVSYAFLYMKFKF